MCSCVAPTFAPATHDFPLTASALCRAFFLIPRAGIPRLGEGALVSAMHALILTLNALLFLPLPMQEHRLGAGAQSVLGVHVP
jgi:hypothetical protein